MADALSRVDLEVGEFKKEEVAEEQLNTVVLWAKNEKL